MSETLERMQARARELARSGKFSGWRSVAFELQFEPGLKEVFQWLHGASVEDAHGTRGQRSPSDSLAFGPPGQKDDGLRETLHDFPSVNRQCRL